MPEKTETRSLHRKLAQVMYEAERIPKNGRAPQAMGGFEFVQVGDAADVIRKALAEKNVTMIPTAIELISESEHSTSSGKMMTTMTVRTTWTLTDGESGESTVIQSMGSGADMGDKAAPKAQSNALKYGLLMGFMLSTGDDPELSDSSDRRRNAPDAATATQPGADAPARPPQPDVETEELVGDLKPPRTGIVKAGGGAGYKLEARQGPDGHVIGFALETAKGNIPQCIVDGALGEALYKATGMNPARLIGEKVTLRGRLYQVKRPGRQGYHRLHVTGIETNDWTLPADEPAPPGQVADKDTLASYAEPVLPEPPEDVELVDEAPSVPLGLVS